MLHLNLPLQSGPHHSFRILTPLRKSLRFLHVLHNKGYYPE